MNSSVRSLREALSETNSIYQKLLLSVVIDTLETSRLATKASREEDPEWFEGGSIKSADDFVHLL